MEDHQRITKLKVALAWTYIVLVFWTAVAALILRLFLDGHFDDHWVLPTIIFCVAIGMVWTRWPYANELRHGIRTLGEATESAPYGLAVRAPVPPNHPQSRSSLWGKMDDRE